LEQRKPTQNSASASGSVIYSELPQNNGPHLANPQIAKIWKTPTDQETKILRKFETLYSAISTTLSADRNSAEVATFVRRNGSSPLPVL
jgi:hypothetical protein